MARKPALKQKGTGPWSGFFLRFAASGAIPARWYQPELPPEEERAAATGVLDIEVVTHCWNYAHLLVYQLDSLVNFPPTKVTVKLTVYYAAEDQRTADLLEHYGSLQVPGVSWNWQMIPKEHLFRRSIGRNMAARATRADWIWFTDCDLMFRDDCLDTLGEQLQSRRDALVYPRQERVTSLLESSDPLLAWNDDFQVAAFDSQEYKVVERGRATGPLQIVHGDVARACGYCEVLRYYQEPAQQFCKAREDKAFRWLLRTDGVPIDVPGVYRIRHVSKGRYTGNAWSTKLRSTIRKLQSSFNERRKSKK